MENGTARILIVDDDPTVLYTMEMLLETEAYEIDFARSGQEALKQVEAHPPDVILLDVMMPNMTGYEACRLLKADPRWGHIPITLITALTSKEALVQGLEAGADEFLSKPVGGTELRARVRSMLRIKRQYDALQELLKIREEMAHMLVHDMRSPLASIILYCDLLTHLVTKEETPSASLADQIMGAIETIRRQGSHLDSMISNLLLLAKKQAGQLVLEQVPVDVNALLQEVVADNQKAAATHAIEFELNLPDNGVTSNLDRGLMYRVFDNLLKNAIKFTHRQGRVTVDLTSEGETAETRPTFAVAIRDQGQGIPPEHHERIFERYEVIQTERQDLIEASLGLAFCKMVVSAHDGQIFVTANVPEGSVFTVQVPV